MKTCSICGKEFPAERNQQKYCSDACYKEKKREDNREYYQRPEAKAKKREYYQRSNATKSPIREELKLKLKGERMKTNKTLNERSKLVRDIEDCFYLNHSLMLVIMRRNQLKEVLNKALAQTEAGRRGEGHRQEHTSLRRRIGT